MRRKLFALFAALALTGCSNLAYYSKAVGGHLEVMSASRPIDDLLADRTTPTETRGRLAKVKEIREFASRELALPDNGSYRSFADLGRPYVVWNVFATREFSLAPENWCMLVVGCVSYRGFYDPKDANDFAGELQQQGLDTYVGGVSAYSTLGYFNDPVLNTFLRQGETEVARLIFHELTHQLVFVEGDTVFNESLATAVENEGIRRWFARHATPEKSQAFALQQRRRAEFSALVKGCRQQLAELYAAGLPAEQTRQRKRALFEQLKTDYADLKTRSWDGFDGYDRWFDDVNNAKISAIGSYSDLVPAFEAMIAAEGGDLARFYRRAAELAKLPKAERTAALDALRPAPAAALALAARRPPP